MKNNHALDPLIISLSGLPCSGKTTLAKEYAKKFIDTHYEPCNVKITQELTDNSTVFISKQIELLKKELIHQEQLKQKARILGKTFVIQDRGFNDILCFTEYYLTKVICKKIPFPEDLITRMILHNSINIYLDIPREILELRIVKRIKTTYGRGIKDLTNYLYFYENWFKSHPNVNILSFPNDSISNSILRLDNFIRL